MLKKAGPFKYKRVRVLPSDTHPTNTRFYIMTDQGNYWCPPFKTAWITYPEDFEQCLEINNVFAVRLDLELAAKCHLDEPVDIDIGETIAFQFDVPMYTRKLPTGAKGLQSDDGLCGSSGQHRPKLQIVYGPTGKLAISGMAGNYRPTDDTKRGHSMAELQRNSRPTDKTLPTRPSVDQDADAKD